MEISEVSKEGSEGLKRTVNAIGEVAIGSAMKQLGDDSTIKWALGIGLVHGLACGSAKRGTKAGLVVLGAFTGANVIKNIAKNWDNIKKQ